MQEIGLKVDYQPGRVGDLVAQLTGSYDWEAMIIGFTGGPDPYSGISFWHSGEGLHLWYPNQPEPATEWEARIDELYILASRGVGPRQAGRSVPPGAGNRRRERPRHLHDALRTAECRTKRLRQHDTHSVRDLGHPLYVPNGLTTALNVHS